VHEEIDYSMLAGRTGIGIPGQNFRKRLNHPASGRD
jgi:hypothetical protein